MIRLQTIFISKMKGILALFMIILCFGCSQDSTDNGNTSPQTIETVTAKDILGNPNYQAISYGGHRENTRDIQPTVEEIKEDMKILFAMGIRVLRTYNTTKFKHASTVLEGIHQLKQEDPNFEMYVMLGVWIDCENAFTDHPNHEAEDVEGNTLEIDRAVELTKQYPDIVKIIAVGNEAMVKWAASYFVQPWVILKWVNHLQDLKKTGELPEDLWITSSDNFASWGGGGGEYHVEDLTKLAHAVDYISLHTYPMHDTHYNPVFWGVSSQEGGLSNLEQIDMAMNRSIAYAKAQYDSTSNYLKRVGVDKPVHIGETGWATFSNGHYGSDGSKATDEYKEALFHQKVRAWTNEAKISCFYFEAFDEIWKDAGNTGGSENYFGLFTVDGKAKYGLWDLVDQGVFDGLTRGGNPITKTYDGNEEELLKEVLLPPAKEFAVN